MFRKSKSLIICAAALAASAGAAIAQGAIDGPFTGIYVYGGANFNSNNYDIVGDGTIGPVSFGFNLPDLGGEGLGATIGVGYDFQVSPTMVVGGFVDYSMPNNENDTMATLTSPGPNFTFDYALTQTNSATLGVRAGYLPNQTTLIYGLLGYNWSNWDGDFTLTGLGPPITSSYSFSNEGISVGAGVETMLNDRFSMALEYRYTKFDDYDLLSIGPLVNIDMESASHTAILRVAYRF